MVNYSDSGHTTGVDFCPYRTDKKTLGNVKSLAEVMLNPDVKQFDWLRSLETRQDFTQSNRKLQIKIDIALLELYKDTPEVKDICNGVKLLRKKHIEYLVKDCKLNLKNKPNFAYTQEFLDYI